MKSKSATLSRQLRYQRWAEEIKSCENRPIGMSVAQWCRDNNIKEPTYYTHLHKVKECVLDSIPVESEQSLSLMQESKPAFVELPMPQPSNNQPIVTITCGNATLEITENISDEFLARIIRAISRA
jgi:hypothetical protein